MPKDINSFSDWMRNMERRVGNTERRPTVRSAADIMGPGLGPQAILLHDWNDEATLFNGVFYSLPAAINSPDPTKTWIGTSWVTPEGVGLQRISDLSNLGVWPPATWVRGFRTNAGLRTYSSWALE